METTNPVAEVASPEDRLEALFSGKGKTAADEAKPADPKPELEGDEADEEEDTDDEAADEGQADDEGASTDEAETAEIEVDGKVYTVPKELEPAFLKSKDYTHKTQELAERRRAVDEREQFMAQVEQTRGAVFEKAVEMRAIEQQLDRFAKLDWQGLADQGGSDYLKLDRAHRELQEQHARMHGEVQNLIAQQQGLSATERQQRLQRGNEELAREIKAWSPELGRKLLDNGKQYGFTDAELAEVIDPRYVRVLHDAYQWRQLQSSKDQLKKKVEHVKPVTVKAARSAQTNQAAQQLDASRSRLKKTGNAKDAEEALFRIFDRNRKR